MKAYHHQGAQLNSSNQGIDFFCGENGNYHHVGNGFLEFDIILRENCVNFNNSVGDGIIDEPNRLVNNAFAYAFSIATLSTTGGEEIGQNIYVGHVSTIMRLLTSNGEI